MNYYCDVCKVPNSCEENHIAHLRGKQHQKKLRYHNAQVQGQVPSSISNAPSPTDPVCSRQSSPSHTSQATVQSHAESASVVSSSSNASDHVRGCSICYVLFTSSASMAEHFAGEKHKKKERARENAHITAHFCDVCSVAVNSLEQLALHSGSPNHLSMKGRKKMFNEINGHSSGETSDDGKLVNDRELGPKSATGENSGILRNGSNGSTRRSRSPESLLRDEGPSPKRVFEYRTALYCKLCDKHFTGPSCAQQHYASEKHRKKEAWRRELSALPTVFQGTQKYVADDDTAIENDNQAKSGTETSTEMDDQRSPQTGIPTPVGVDIQQVGEPQGANNLPVPLDQVSPVSTKTEDIEERVSLLDRKNNEPIEDQSESDVNSFVSAVEILDRASELDDVTDATEGAVCPMDETDGFEVSLNDGGQLVDISEDVSDTSANLKREEKISSLVEKFNDVCEEYRDLWQKALENRAKELAWKNKSHGDHVVRGDAIPYKYAREAHASPSVPRPDSYGRCDLCKVGYTSPSQKLSHENGRKHKKKMRAAGLLVVEDDESDDVTVQEPPKKTIYNEIMEQEVNLLENVVIVPAEENVDLRNLENEAIESDS
ncbi:zinc finger RNA-binding protein-like [Ptychodera flava]|uniref:zinc finger RNA-binding protein-like n=1 Tax=Ptychodera flava TaxID=63121 RepID=UPI003969DED5